MRISVKTVLCDGRRVGIVNTRSINLQEVLLAVCGLKTSFYGLLTPFCTAFVPIDLLTGFSLPVNRGLVLGNSNRLLLFLQVTPVRDLSLLMVVRSLGGPDG